MGTVFFFLTTMVLVMYAAAAFFRTHFNDAGSVVPATAPKVFSAAEQPILAPAPEPAPQTLPAGPTLADSAVSKSDDETDVAVAIAAVKAYLIK